MLRVIQERHNTRTRAVPPIVSSSVHVNFASDCNFLDRPIIDHNRTVIVVHSSLLCGLSWMNHFSEVNEWFWKWRKLGYAFPPSDLLLACKVLLTRLVGRGSHPVVVCLFWKTELEFTFRAVVQISLKYFSTQFLNSSFTTCLTVVQYFRNAT